MSTESLRIPGVRAERYFLGVPWSEISRPDRLAFAVPLCASIAGFVVGAALVASDDADFLAVPALGAMALGLGIAALQVRGVTGAIDRQTWAYVLAALACAVAMLVVPKWIYGWDINAIISRTAISGPLTLVLSAAVFGRSLRSLLADAPAAADYALGVWLLLPIVAAGAAYSRPHRKDRSERRGWPAAGLARQFLERQPADAGLPELDHGYAAAHDHVSGHGFPASGGGRSVRFPVPGPHRDRCGSRRPDAASRSAIHPGRGSLADRQQHERDGPQLPLSVIVRGVYTDPVSGSPMADKGSFFLAAVFVALVVLPVVAKMTEEGLRSVPRELKEASVALGARDGYSLRRILLPWAAPNI